MEFNIHYGGKFKDLPIYQYDGGITKTIKMDLGYLYPQIIESMVEHFSFHKDSIV